MVQVRKLVLAIAAASALSSGMAHALGLGEMTLKSAQNQPLAVEIELLDVGGLSASEIVPSLASAQAFSGAGVDRQAFLDDLIFTPVLNPGGRSVVRVTSSKPLPEAYVRFLLQVKWPSGSLTRDYSLLLDPSKFDKAGASAPAAAPAPVHTPAPRLAAPTTAAKKVSKTAQHTTTSRDTLWEIAAKVRNGGSIQQTMLAIQALNPDAFIDGNINRLKTGKVLRLPDPVQSASLAQPAAIAEVTRQNSEWRQGRRATGSAQGKAQLDATKRAQVGNAPAKTSATDNLSLVSAEAAKAQGKGAVGDSQALSNKLATTQESLDSTRRENDELRSRMTDLQSQLDKLQRLIQLKNDQLAKLQAQSGMTVDPALSAELVAQPGEAPAGPALEDALPEVVSPQVPAKEDPPAPVAEEQYRDVLTNPLLLTIIGGAAGVAVLLLLLLWVRHRNARREEEKHLRMARALAEEPELVREPDLPLDDFEGLDVPPPSVKLAAAPIPAPVTAPAPAPTPLVAPVAVPVAAPPAEHTTDALVQAQSHLDRGHLNQAAEVLEEAIKLEPQRSDLRLKLMEVHGLQGNRDGFVAQERQLMANGENHAQAEQLKSRFPAVAVAVGAAAMVSAAAAAELDAQYVKDLLNDKPQEPEASVATEQDLNADFDLSLDDLEAASPAVVKPELAQDDVLSFESVLQQQAEAKASLDDLSDFDLDLGDEFSVSSASDDDFLAGLEEQMKDLPVVEAPVVAAPAAIDDLELPEDFDLSLADDPAEGPSDMDALAAEFNDLDAELDRLSQSLESPAFTEADAAVGDDEDFDFLAGTDEVATKLDLAQAYMDMGDNDGARDILDEVLKEGNDKQKTEAKDMLNLLV